MKRHYFIFSFVLLTTALARALSISSVMYENKLSPPLQTQSIASSFPKNYETSRQRFLTYHTMFEKKAIPVLNLSAPITNLEQETLSIDGLHITGEDTTKLLILTSGIHGAEAFAGSALQDFFVQYLLNEAKPKTSVLLIHAINPHGFKYFRRANPNNVDLNRNHADKTEFSSTNEAFEKLVTVYSPEGGASTGMVPQVGFYISILLKYFIVGKKIVLDSLSGQYKYPQTIFYGGSKPEEETLVVQEWIKTFAKNKTHIVHIDLHTGFGEKGKLHFYGSDEYTSPDQIKKIRSIFPDAEIDTGRSADFYPTKGDFVDWTWKSQPEQNVIPMVFEFGTMDSQKISGGLRSLWSMVLENQGYHYSFGTELDSKIIRRRFEELFNPQDSQWQYKVYEQGARELVDAYTNFQKI